MNSERKRRVKAIVYERDSGKCKLCEKPLTYEDATLDHIIPRCKGGSNRIKNLTIMCKSCNGFKADKSLELARRLWAKRSENDDF